MLVIRFHDVVIDCSSVEKLLRLWRGVVGQSLLGNAGNRVHLRPVLGPPAILLRALLFYLFEVLMAGRLFLARVVWDLRPRPRERLRHFRRRVEGQELTGRPNRRLPRLLILFACGQFEARLALLALYRAVLGLHLAVEQALALDAEHLGMRRELAARIVAAHDFLVRRVGPVLGAAVGLDPVVVLTAREPSQTVHYLAAVVQVLARVLEHAAASLLRILVLASDHLRRSDLQLLLRRLMMMNSLHVVPDHWLIAEGLGLAHGAGARVDRRARHHGVASVDLVDALAAGQAALGVAPLAMGIPQRQLRGARAEVECTVD